MVKVSTIINKLRGSQLFNDSFWAVVGSVVGRGLTLLAGIYIARQLGSALYGEYGIIKNSLMMIAMFSSMGLGYSTTKFIADGIKQSQNERVINTHRIAQYITLIVSGIIAILTAIYAKEIAVWLEAEHLHKSIRLITIAIIFNAINTTQIGELSGFGAYREIAKNNTIGGIFTLVVTILLTTLYKYDGAICALISSLILTAILNRFTIQRHIKRYAIIQNKISYKFTVEIIKFSFPIALQESLFAIGNWVSTIILIKYSGYAELGISSAASIWMNIMLFIPGALRNVSLSHLSSADNNKTTLRRLLGVNLVSTFIPCLIVGLTSNIITTMYGESFSGLRLILPITMVSAIICSMANVLSQELIAKGDNWILFSMGATRCVVGIICLYIFTQIYTQGALIAALITLITHIIYLLAMSIYVTKKFK